MQSLINAAVVVIAVVVPALRGDGFEKWVHIFSKGAKRVQRSGVLRAKAMPMSLFCMNI